MYAKHGGFTLLGKCELYGKEITTKTNKDGKHIVDIGCNKWEEKRVI